MANELMVFEDSKVVALTAEGQELAEVRAENGEDFDMSSLVRVRTPSSGGTKWEVDDGIGNTESVETLHGVLVACHKYSVLWPTEGDAQEGTIPVLVSSDLRYAYGKSHPSPHTLPPGHEALGDIDPAELAAAGTVDDAGRTCYDMAKLSYCQWGTSRNGRGCRMKEQRVLGVLPLDGMMPLILTVQPGSVKDVSRVISRLPFFHYQAVVRLGLEKAKTPDGTAYSKIVMTVEPEPIPREQAAVLKSMFREPIHDAIRASVVPPAEVDYTDADMADEHVDEEY